MNTPATAGAHSWPPRVRPATVDDIEAICAIERASFRSPWPRQVLLDEISGRTWSRVKVAELGGRVAGFMVYWVVGPELHLLNLAVDAHLRKRGVGRMMLDHLIDEGERLGKEELLLEVRVSNRAARQLYERLRFIELSIRPRYYADNDEDAIVMCRVLSPPSVPSGSGRETGEPTS